MGVKLLLVIATIILSISNAYADFFYKLVGYECDEKADAVILTYKGALNEAGKEMMKNKGTRQWDPWKLIIRDTKKRDWIGSHKTVDGQCKLSDGTYEITIGPLPGNDNLQGKCGGFMSAWAEVRRGSEIVLPRHMFEFGDCHVAEPVTTEIIIEAGGKEPIIKKIPWDEFYE
ncbi:MAG: hypothetical protein CVU64_19910 [Deltaproteobacteria bacterium HGW-Deltaproteobacteria-21]|nr:MAG: hypothetical protein CVU64_19910 [Deltaproteobacteria bacterium HGW-Deltaproteobacteria-21]